MNVAIAIAVAYFVIGVVVALAFGKAAANGDRQAEAQYEALRARSEDD